jgi:hypothetical protein
MKHALLVLSLSLSLFLVSCGGGNNNNKSVETDTIHPSEIQILDSDKPKEVPDMCLTGENLPPLTESVVKEYDYKFEFEVFDSLIFKQENKKFLITIEKFKERCPGDFHLIKIFTDNKQSVFFNPDGWVAKNITIYDVPMLSSANLSSKNYLSIIKFSENNYLLFVFGYPYASSPSLITIINLTQFDNSQLIFNKEYELYDIADCNGDGLLDIFVSGYFKYMKTDEDGHLLDRNEIVDKYILIDGCFQKLKK